MQKKVFTTEFGNKTLTAEFNDLAVHANGSVMLRYGETVVLVTAVMGKSETSLPYFPLSVEFEEKFYAAGAILGSRFMRREGRPSDEAVLSARIIDRTIRPLFPTNLKVEIQIVVTVLALGEDDPDLLGLMGASLALSTSNIPWNGPVSISRQIKKTDGEIIVNPTYKERHSDDITLEVLACGRDEKINMIETAGKEAGEVEVISMLESASQIHTALQAFQEKIIAEIGREKKVFAEKIMSQELVEFYKKNFEQKLYNTLFSKRAGKDHIYEMKNEFLKEVEQKEDLDVDKKVAGDFFEDMIDHKLHEGAVLENKRADGRDLDTVRVLYAEAGGISPALHGSGIFYRGGTRIFSALTLGGPEAALLIDSIEEQDTKKRFMHHYNFPPFSVGEAGRVGGFNRRMIGHGNLAEKALLPLIPHSETFPYTIRLVSETMSSNGSSSMGSVCGSSLALMDGGVPIKKHVAGIASGVMIMGNKYSLLTDIQGPEDEFGDMDFKVAGTDSGITAIQMDVKVDGISLQILTEALDKAKAARIEILKVMNKAIDRPRAQISDRAPEIISLSILPEQIGLVIGGGGKTIKAIKEETGVEEITIEEDGQIFISGKNGTAKLAADRIASLTKVYAIGEKVMATITKITTFGAFASIDGQNEGLIHISEIAPFRLESVEGILKVGETLPVIVSKVENGKIGLSIKQADPDFATKRNIPKP